MHAKGDLPLEPEQTERVKKHMSLFVACFTALFESIQSHLRRIEPNQSESTESFAALLQSVKTDYQIYFMVMAQFAAKQGMIDVVQKILTLDLQAKLL